MLSGRRSIALALLLLGGSCRTDRQASTPSGSAPSTPASPSIDPQRLLGTVQALAGDQLGGRYSLHGDIDRAARVIENEFEAMGIEPVGENYRHPFGIAVGATQLEPPTLSLRGRGKAKDVALDTFAPLPGSASGRIEGELVFVGYAVRSGTGDSASYDDLDGLDLEGKIAVLLLDAPRRPDAKALYARLRSVEKAYEERAVPLRDAGDQDALRRLQSQTRAELAAVVEPFLHGRPIPATALEVPADPTAPLSLEEFASLVFFPSADDEAPAFSFVAGRLRAKLRRLKDAGVAGVITVRGPRSFVDEEARDTDALPRLDTMSPVRDLEIPVVQMKWRAADTLLSIGRRKLSSVQGQIDRELRPQSKPLGKTAALSVKLEARELEAPNVVGQLVGRTRPDEFLIVGAHYDHIGTDEDGHGHCKALERQGTRDSVCNGADDNASGTAVVLEIARMLAAAPSPPERTVVFALFAGEELGLLGSRALADHPPEAAPWSSGHAVAMINIDMVGRLRPDPGLLIGGLGSSPQWMPMFEQAGLGEIPIVFDRSITSRSDHASFYKHDIPVVFLFTGVHGDYHAPGDEVAGINVEGLASVATLTYGVAQQIASGADITFAAPTKPSEGLVGALPGDNPDTVERRVGF